MTEQAFFSDDTSWPLRNVAAVLVGILAMGLLLQMARPLFELFDIGLPWRQLTMNRNLKVMVVSCHVLFVITCSYITTRQCGKLLNNKKGVKKVSGLFFPKKVSGLFFKKNKPDTFFEEK